MTSFFYLRHPSHGMDKLVHKFSELTLTTENAKLAQSEFKVNNYSMIE